MFFFRALREFLRLGFTRLTEYVNNKSKFHKTTDKYVITLIFNLIPTFVKFTKSRYIRNILDFARIQLMTSSGAAFFFVSFFSSFVCLASQLLQLSYNQERRGIDC